MVSQCPLFILGQPRKVQMFIGVLMSMCMESALLLIVHTCLKTTKAWWNASYLYMQCPVKYPSTQCRTWNFQQLKESSLIIFPPILFQRLLKLTWVQNMEPNYRLYSWNWPWCPLIRNNQKIPNYDFPKIKLTKTSFANLQYCDSLLFNTSCIKYQPGSWSTSKENIPSH